MFIFNIILLSLILVTQANPADRQAASKADGIEYVDNEPFRNDTSRDYRQDFYVITTIFNPASYKSRYTLYKDFAKTIRGSGAQLVTVECIFPSLGQHKFHVTSPSNRFDIQLKSESVYWVKEDLINIAVKHLPPTARWVSWLDADIYFHQKDWIEKTISALERHSVVQMFKFAHFLNSENEIHRTDYSFGYSVVKGKPLFGSSNWYPHPGYGWAMSKSTFDKIGGLPSYAIVGSGDLSFAYSLVNSGRHVTEKSFNEDYKDGIREDSEKVYKQLVYISDAESKSVVGFVPVGISHRWHGSRKDRGYVDRLKLLIAHDFNYFKDMTKGDDGLLRFGNNTASLQQDIRCYFENRNEDNQKKGRVACDSDHFKLWLTNIFPKPVPRPQTCTTPGGAGVLPNFYNFYNFYTS